MGNREHYRQGMSAFNAGRYAEAIEHLTPPADRALGARRLLSRFYLGQAHYFRGIELFRQRRFEQAMEHFQAAARINPTSGGLAGFLAACYMGTGRYDLAGRELNELCRRSPDDAEVRIRLALTLWKQGNPTEALATLREGLARCPEHPELNYQLGVMLAADDELAEAERLFEKTLIIDSTHGPALERLAQCYAVQGRYERAWHYLKKAHEHDPLNARIALQLHLLSRSMAGTSGVSEITWPVSRPAAARRTDERSLDRLAEALVAEPDFVESFLSLPSTEMDEEVFSLLAATLEKALSRYPEYADLHYHCGEVYRRLGRGVEALMHTQQAVDLNPRYVNALILLARLYGQADQYAAGMSRLEQAIAAGADYPDVHYLMGQLCQKAGQTDRAREAYRRALVLKKDYPAARAALAAVEA